MHNKYILTAISSLFIFPAFLCAYHGGGEGGHVGGGVHDGGYYGGDRHYNEQNYGYGVNGYIGAPFYGEYINPYPPPGSQPGMSDDSDALYNSYLHSNQDSSFFRE